MNSNVDVNIQEHLSSDESSDQLSRISDDSGIEDWFDDMTIQTEPSVIPQPDTFLEEKQKEEGANIPVEEQVFIGPKLPEESSDIFPSFPDIPEGAEVKKDVPDENGIPGVCGLYNLGNTCFMNAALQCLLAIPTLQEIVKMDYSTTPESAAFLKPLIDHLQELYGKIFSGQYSILHPVTLHSGISSLHPLFGDFKQHDSQEFISFVLNIIHDFLNLSGESYKEKIDENDKDLSEKITGEVTKRLKMEHSVSVEMEPDAGVECDEGSITKAEVAWRKYLKTNKTVIADKLQGQFQSVITCEKCGFVSTTYEPFMFLSLSIPYAMERQIPVTWVAAPKVFGSIGELSAKRYLVTVNKSGSMKNLKDVFFEVLRKDDEHIKTTNIVFAEVKNSANFRILDDKTQLQYLLKTSTIYAVEIFSLPGNEDSVVGELGEETTTTWHVCNVCFEEKFEEDLLVHRSCSGKLCSDCLQSTIKYSQNSVGDFPCPEGYEPMSKKRRKEPCETSDVSMVTNGKPEVWRNCNICLEDTFDDEMRSHVPCGGMICSKCIRATANFHENNAFPCPTCQHTVVEQDYTKLITEQNSQSTPVRRVLVPILFRYAIASEEESKKKMFGNPHISRLPSELTHDTLYDVVSVLSKKYSLSPEFDVVITDASGLSCGFCDILSTCCGCNAKNLSEIKLKPGCCITIHFNQHHPQIVKTLAHFKEDESMNLLRSSDVVSLQECMEKFADVEILTEDNPWYCPNCQLNQVSQKVMSVTRWPETLIIHLKRFHFENTQGSKITCPIDYPMSDLNVDLLTCADALKNATVYDLCGCVNHVGSLFGGHYTAFTKKKEAWFYFNDSSFEKRSPVEDEDHQTEAYVLFYRMKGS